MTCNRCDFLARKEAVQREHEAYEKSCREHMIRDLRERGETGVMMMGHTMRITEYSDNTLADLDMDLLTVKRQWAKKWGMTLPED